MTVHPRGVGNLIHSCTWGDSSNPYIGIWNHTHTIHGIGNYKLLLVLFLVHKTKVNFLTKNSNQLWYDIQLTYFFQILEVPRIAFWQMGNTRIEIYLVGKKRWLMLITCMEPRFHKVNSFYAKMRCLVLLRL